MVTWSKDLILEHIVHIRWKCLPKWDLFAVANMMIRSQRLEPKGCVILISVSRNSPYEKREFERDTVILRTFQRED